MSEQLPPEVEPPEIEPVKPPAIEPIEQSAIQPIEQLPRETAEAPARPARLKWIAPAWFFLGVIVGIVGFAAYNAFAAPKPVANQVAALDAATMRDAARGGVLEAIATLQAGGPQQPAAQESAEPTAVPQNAFTLRDANRMGPANAKVTVIEFADYQCPFCERVHQSVWPTLKQYAEAGKIALVYKHSAFLGQESVWAAQASECAANQGKFWEFHDLLFNKQNGENVGTFTKENLIKYAQGLNLDMAKFEPCLNNDETLPRVKADTQEGNQAGVRGTPTFFINGKALVGAQPLQVFQQEIDAALGN